MAISAYISGVKVVILRGSVRVDKRIEERDVASFVVVDATSSFSAVRGMPVELYDSTPTLIFSGFIATPEKARIAPGFGLLHDITCMDNHYLADKRLVTESYVSGLTPEFIINDIYEKYLIPEGVTLGSIEATGLTLSGALFNYVKVSDAYDAIKELCGTFIWFLDEFKKLYFIARTTAAAWHLDGATHQAIQGSVRLSTGNPLYRNFQYVWGGTGITVPLTLVFKGDGVLKTFTLGYPLAKVPSSITVESRVPEAQTIGIKGIDTGKDVYWSKGDPVIVFTVAPESGKNVTAIYQGQFPLISAAVDSAAITARQAIEGGTGIVEDIVREAWHESSESSRESAKAKLTQFCQDAEKFIYDTHDSGLLPGRLQNITYPPFGFAAHPMLIASVLITAEGDLITYRVSCITGPSMGSWSQFFSRLLKRQDQAIRIGGDLLLKLLVKAESLTLAEATDIHSDDFSSGIVNRWIALPPATSAGCNVEHERLGLVEAPALVDHITEDYHWDDADALWSFATWG